MADHPIVPATPLDGEIVPLESNRPSVLKAMGDLVKTRDLIHTQSNAVCLWLNSRQGSGMSIKQDITIKGRIFKRTIKAAIVVKTW